MQGVGELSAVLTAWHAGERGLGDWRSGCALERVWDGEQLSIICSLFKESLGSGFSSPTSSWDARSGRLHSCSCRIHSQQPPHLCCRLWLCCGIYTTCSCSTFEALLGHPPLLIMLALSRTSVHLGLTLLLCPFRSCLDQNPHELSFQALSYPYLLLNLWDHNHTLIKII
jgi:hypothetical protein